MIDEKRSVEEQVGTAISRADLEWWEGACSLDKIVALAYGHLTLARSKAGRRMHPIVRAGAFEAVFGLKIAQQANSYKTSLGAVSGLARQLNGREGWRLHRPRLDAMAAMVLGYWMNDVCPRCTGRRFERYDENTPVLMDRVCPRCDGTGKRRYPWGKSPRHKHLLITLEEIEQRVVKIVTRRLKGRRR
jgi:hypothetical protein